MREYIPKKTKLPLQTMCRRCGRFFSGKMAWSDIDNKIICMDCYCKERLIAAGHAQSFRKGVVHGSLENI